MINHKDPRQPSFNTRTKNRFGPSTNIEYNIDVLKALNTSLYEVFSLSKWLPH
jgi:hypothetical protein